jgi:hypothetical protein
MNNTKINKNEMLSASRVCRELDISSHTLDSWYKYYNSDEPKREDMPTLPKYIQTRPRGPRYWNLSDIPALQAFKEWVPRGRAGVMGRINERYWSAKYRNKSEEETTNG